MQVYQLMLVKVRFTQTRKKYKKHDNILDSNANHGRKRVPPAKIVNPPQLLPYQNKMFRLTPSPPLSAVFFKFSRLPMLERGLLSCKYCFYCFYLFIYLFIYSHSSMLTKLLHSINN